MNGKHITKLGYQNKAIGLALTVANQLEAAGLGRAEILQQLSQVKADPCAFAEQPSYDAALYGELLAHLQAEFANREASKGDKILPQPRPYKTWGTELIDPDAHRQMRVAMRLPSAQRGALMPDAHVGYGLPIGGVLATAGTVVPYAVGVDIGCSMMLSVLPLAWRDLSVDEAKALLLKHTRFGAGVGFDKRERDDHEVLHENTWQQQPLLKHLHDKAAAQIGSSGSGNHFAEFGTVTLKHSQALELGLEAGKQYVAVLSHSGSRGFGAQVAGHFTALAKKLHPHIDKEALNLAWLDMDSQEGTDYWQAMQLAGRYALANHQLIHARLAQALKVTPLSQVSNSHNLAWQQEVDGQQLIVHRKGATPAASGQLGIIPGSMAAAGYVVRGLGKPEALASASHGAGRQLGRRAAQNSLSKQEVKRYLDQRGITLIGGGIDEAPQAYKSLKQVLSHQSDLVEVLAEFMPKVVRMDTGSEDI